MCRMHTNVWWVLVKETDMFEHIAAAVELNTGRP